MALIVLTGRPGKGKTLTMVDISRKKFNELNPPLKIWLYELLKKKDWIYKINQYADFPIVYKSKRKKQYKYYDELGNIKTADIITAIPFRIFDLILKNKFVENADFYIDEIQSKYDSMEYKDFPDAIAHYCQSHRHFGEGDIFIASQSQSRVIKRLLVLCEEYWKIEEFSKIFNKLAWCSIRITWELANGIETSIINEDKVDVEYTTRFFWIPTIAKMYDSKYLKELVKDAFPYKTKQYSSKNMTRDEIMHTFFPSDEERKQIKELNY